MAPDGKACTARVACRFDGLFLEPMSHTILNGLTRGFLNLVCDTTNGLIVNGKPFHLSPATQNRMDGVISRLRLPSAFNRPPSLLRQGCVPLLWCEAASRLTCYRLPWQARHMK